MKSFDIVFVDKLDEQDMSPAAEDETRGIIYIAKKFFKYSEYEQMAILAHEIAHAMNLHVYRGMQKDHMIWNIAADAVVNRYVSQDLRDINAESYLKSIGAIFDDTVSSMFNIPVTQISGKSPEEIYELIRQKGGSGKDKSGRSKRGRFPDIADVEDAKSQGKDIQGKKVWTGDKAEDIRKHRYSIDDLENEMRRTAEEIAKQANEMEAKFGGKGAGSIMETIRPKPSKLYLNRLNVALDRWYRGDVVQSYSRYSRRFPMLPSTMYIGLGLIYVLIDVSGSISTEDLQQFAGEIDALARRYGRVVVMQWDSGIRKIDNVTGRLYELKVTGRGGTELAPALQEFMKSSVAGLGASKPALIIFSDFYLYDKQEATDLLNQMSSRYYIIQVSTTDEFLDVPRSEKIKLKS